MSKREAAGVLAQCKWLKDQIKGWEEAAKEVVGNELSRGERTAAIAPDGTDLGYVTMSKGKRGIKIDNEEGFLMWVKQRYPTEIVETVRPAFIKLCQEKMVKLGALPDANGELCPHVSLSEGEPYPFVTLDAFAAALMQRMILERKLMDVVTPPSELPAAQNHSYDDAADLEPEPNGSPDPEPFIEEGPPNWQDSNSFETSDAVHQRRMR